MTWSQNLINYFIIFWWETFFLPKFFLKDITTIFKEQLINEQITAKEVRLIGTDGEQLGVMPIEKARQIADNEGLDLVLMSGSSNPAVCKIMDYGKYRFDSIKREKEMKKNQKIVELKEIQLTMRIDQYHINFKLKSAQKILQEGDKVKVSLRMKGREQAYSKNAVEVVENFVNALSEFGSVDKKPEIVGRNVIVVINPKKTK